MQTDTNKTTRTKYAEDYIREQLAGGVWQAGDVLPVSDELAGLLNISKITLSNAMEPLVREGLLVRKAGVGTIVTDINGQNGKGIIIYTSAGLDSINRSPKLASGDISYFEMALVRHIAGCLQEANTQYALVSNCRSTTNGFLEEPYISNMSRISGAIELVERRIAASLDTVVDFPVVSLSPYVSDAKNEVVVDLAACYKNGFDILKSNGISKVLFINYDYDLSAEYVDQYQSVRDKLIAGGVAEILRCNPDTINLPISYETIISGAAYYKTRQYLENNPLPEAIFVGDDTFISGVYLALKDMKIQIPDDLKVICISTKGRDYGFEMNWTRLEYDVESIAQTFVNILNECINGNNSGIKQYAWPVFIKGSSM